MILMMASSIRSLWAIPFCLAGLAFVLAGAAMASAVLETETAPITSVGVVVLGAAVVVLGLAAVRGGLRMGVVRQDDALMVREYFGGTKYGRERITGFSLHEEEHDMVPLITIAPVIALSDGSEHVVRCLTTYRFLPGARALAYAAIGRMSQWTDRPVLSEPPDAR
jgi:hypothetical protein